MLFLYIAQPLDSNMFYSSCSGLPELHKTLGEGRSAPQLKKVEIWLKTNFLKVCYSVKYIKIIILKIGFVKEKFPLKSYSGKTLGKGRSSLPQGN